MNFVNILNVQRGNVQKKDAFLRYFGIAKATVCDLAAQNSFRLVEGFSLKMCEGVFLVDVFLKHKKLIHSESLRSFQNECFESKLRVNTFCCYTKEADGNLIDKVGLRFGKGNTSWPRNTTNVMFTPDYKTPWLFNWGSHFSSKSSLLGVPPN